MTESLESLSTAFWQAVQSRLAERNYSRSEIKSMTSRYVMRITDVSDLDLVYHQGIDATVKAVEQGGYVTDPRPTQPKHLVGELDVLRRYLASET